MSENAQRRSYWLAFLFCSILIYELPYFLTLRNTGWTPLPPVVDYPADQMLYLTLSAVEYRSPSVVVNPWYGNQVPAADVPHLRFPITFLLFRFTHTIFGSWTTAMLAWAAFWAGLTFAAAVFCLDSFFPDSDRRLRVLAALALLVLESPLVYIYDLRQLPSLSAFHMLWLPYLRFAYPQVIVPAVLAYLGLQALVLKSGSNWELAGMAFLQFGTFAAFPYIVPVVGVGTAIAFLLARRNSNEAALSWLKILTFGMACAALDLAYLLLAHFGTARGNVHFTLQLRPEMIVPALRPYVLALIVGAGFALACRASLAARVTVAGLALSNAFFAFSDVFFPATSMVLVHINYLIELTTWLPIVVIVWHWIEKFNGRTLRVVLTTLLVAIGIWEGFAAYRASLPVNTLEAAAVAELGSVALTSRDLVIAPAQFSDDISCWIPLVSNARVLFTRDGENVLSADAIRGDQAFRQALYLKLRGIDYETLLSYTEPHSSDSLINPIVLFGEIEYSSSPLESDRAKARILIRERLGPMLEKLESEPASAQRLFENYDRIIVIDSSNQPVFQESAFAPWLVIEQRDEHNGTRVWICRSRATA